MLEDTADNGTISCFSSGIVNAVAPSTIEVVPTTLKDCLKKDVIKEIFAKSGMESGLSLAWEMLNLIDQRSTNSRQFSEISIFHDEMQIGVLR